MLSPQNGLAPVHRAASLRSQGETNIMIKRILLGLTVIAFAGAVTMIPGLSLYRALGGGWEVADVAYDADRAP